MKVVVSAGGRFHAFHLAEILARNNHLAQLYTFCYRQQDRKRIPPELVYNSALCDLINSVFSRFRLASLINPTQFNAYKDNLFDWLVSRNSKSLGNIDLFIGWSHYCLKTIPVMRKKGARIIVESGSCHIKSQQRILQQEYDTWGVPFKPIEQSVINKMCAEYEQADTIMTLSSFARASFIAQGMPAEKVITVPCGVNVDYFIKKPIYEKPSKVFRVIFVGLVSIRKGIGYLLQAWNEANIPEKNAELIIVGNVQKDAHNLIKNMYHKKNIRFHGSVTREKLRSLYHASHLFVLPSLEEGFGMVLVEAMASGLPVIATPHSAGPDIIQHKIDGLLVPAANIYALANALNWCYSHQDESHAMGQRAQERAQDFSSQKYEKNIIQIYKNLVYAEKASSY